MEAAPISEIQVTDSTGDCPDTPIVDGDGSAKAVIWPGNGARCRAVPVIRLGAGVATLGLDHETDCIHYVLCGSGHSEDLMQTASEAFVEGSMVHIDAYGRYRDVPAMQCEPRRQPAIARSNTPELLETDGHTQQPHIRVIR